MKNKLKIGSLNLSSNYYPTEYEDIDYTYSLFPAGEVHFKLNSVEKVTEYDKVIVTTRINSSDDIMNLLLAKNALDIIGINKVELVMLYVPYARQDKVHDKGESLSIKVFVNMINNANFNKVHIMDAHSDVTPALINNCINYNNHNFIKQVVTKIEDDFYIEDNDLVLVSPDAGANKKINNLSELLKLNVIKCDKKRDVKTGNLSGFEVYAENLSGKKCLIVDDICDGGRTFTGIVKKLKELGAENVYLAVTHGIFSKGLEILELAGIDEIYCTDSVYSSVLTEVNCINIKLDMNEG